MELNKRKETVAKIIKLLNGLNYGEARIVLESAQDELEFISFVQPAHYPILEESRCKRRDKLQQSLPATDSL